MRDEVKFPDDSTFYLYETASRVYSQITHKKYSVSDAILLLLYAHPEKPIYGRTSMMKQMFLLTREVLPELIQDPKFVKHRYGMYSFFVANCLSNMEFNGTLTRRGRKNARVESFQITEKGKKLIARKFLELPDTVKSNLRKKRKGWDQLGYDGILRYVYTKYPEFRDKSVLKNRYAPILWGRGIA